MASEVAVRGPLGRLQAKCSPIQSRRPDGARLMASGTGQAARWDQSLRSLSSSSQISKASCLQRQGGKSLHKHQPCFRVRARVDAAGKQADTAVPAGSVSVILLSGGVGKRMQANMPKQYIPFLGKPIALHSLELFAQMSEVGEIVVVCDASYRSLFQEAAAATGIKMTWAPPGKERQDSVFSGLQAVSETAQLVAVHDSARPLVTVKDVRQVLKDAYQHGAAVLGVPSKATIKQATKDRFVEKTLDRSTLWEMQTPQVIRPALLKEGFELVNRENLAVTDDVSIVEYLKHPVFITEGSYTNIKITTPDDLIIAERIRAEGKEKVEKQIAVATAV